MIDTQKTESNQPGPDAVMSISFSLYLQDLEKIDLVAKANRTSRSGAIRFAFTNPQQLAVILEQQELSAN